jgi:hypothetical protein
MDPSMSPFLLVAVIAVILLAAWLYFRRVRVERPPVGVFNLRDIAFTFLVLVAIPPLYLELPVWSVASIAVLTATGITYLTSAPVLGRPVAATVAGGVAIAEVVVSSWQDGQSTPFLVLNDIAVAVLVIGVCNIWAQSGVHARDVTVFACAVGVFDLVATWLMPLMLEFFTRVRALPFAPVLAIGTGTGAAAIGMGDLLFIVLWPLVAAKAFALRAGLVAAAGTVGSVAALGVASVTGLVTSAIPAMVVIAPVILVQYLLLRRHHGTERTTKDYEALVPAPPALPIAELRTALALLGAGGDGTTRCLAVHDGLVIATGSSPGAAAKAARERRPNINPVIVRS